MTSTNKKKRFGHVEIPLQRVHIELTNVCQFNCVFCPKAEMTRKYGYMDTDLAKRLITEIRQARLCEKITFHVMGEPTLHKDFSPILDHAKAEGMNVGLTTNGAGLDGPAGKKLLDHHFYQLDISLQTPDTESYELRKPGQITFDQYLEGIMSLFADYIPQHPDTIFKFRFLNTRFPNKAMEKRIGPVRVINSTAELRTTFKYWAGRIYDILGVDDSSREEAFGNLDKLSIYKWNVVEIYPNVFFETYVLGGWGHAFDDEEIKDAWAGYCFGMRDHFAILQNGDVVLCCTDFDGKTAIGNVTDKSLEEVLSSDHLGRIIEGFKKYKVVHPYCKRCLGSTSTFGWATKPFMSVMGLNVLKPFFYKKTNVFPNTGRAAG